MEKKEQEQEQEQEASESEDIFQERNRTNLRCGKCGGTFYETGKHDNHEIEEVKCCGCGITFWVSEHTPPNITLYD